jgi:hypothetical protein
MKIFVACLFVLTLTANGGKSPYNPAYMVKHGGYFGGQQNDYLKRARDIIAKAEKKIHKAVENKEDLRSLFSNILDMMAEERKLIAIDHQTKRADEFGLKRDQNQRAATVCTIFNGRYREYGQRILDRVETILKSGILYSDDADACEGRFFKHKRYTFKSRAFSHSSSIELELSEAEDIQEWFHLPLDKLLPNWFPIKLCLKSHYTPKEEIELSSAIRRLIRENPQQHQKLKRGYDLQTVWHFFPRGTAQNYAEWMENLIRQKAVLVEATIFFEINGKMQPIYEYLTWLHPEEKMRIAMPIVLHQSQYIIEETLSHIAADFERIVHWDRADLAELKQMMALFRYEMACMPFHRGSAAITEWFEAALYNYHKVHYEFDTDRLADLETYCNPFFSEFFQAYDSMYTLQNCEQSS